VVSIGIIIITIFSAIYEIIRNNVIALLNKYLDLNVSLSFLDNLLKMSIAIFGKA
jgi:ABC-type bacteriocin/lantibiotic exporter with double-glycine peptidase domain